MGPRFRGDDEKLIAVVPRERLELPTCGLGNRCSVLLSYRGTRVR